MPFGNSIKVFARANNGNLIQKFSTGATWSGWVNLGSLSGATITGDPAVVGFQNSLNVFARARRAT